MQAVRRAAMNPHVWQGCVNEVLETIAHAFEAGLVAVCEVLAGEFSGFAEGDRYRYIIELGQALPPLTEAERNAANRVHGCVSQVWLVTEPQGSQITYRGESDAMIVRGLIAILHALYSGLSVADVLKVDATAELKRLGLDEHLSQQRSNGVRAMIGRVRKLATEASA
mgnify:CR=1 FL=1